MIVELPHLFIIGNGNILDYYLPLKFVNNNLESNTNLTHEAGTPLINKENIEVSPNLLPRRGHSYR